MEFEILKEYKITIAGEPVAKGRPKFRRIGNYVTTYTPTKTKNNETKIGYIAKSAGIKPIPKDIPVIIRLMFYMPIPKSLSKKKQIELDDKFHLKKPDVDNLSKLCLDSLNGIAWDDDSQIIHLEATKKYSSDPRTEIIISALR